MKLRKKKKLKGKKKVFALYYKIAGPRIVGFVNRRLNQRKPKYPFRCRFKNFKKKPGDKIQLLMPQ